jgi:hypothetical protein
MQTIGCPICGEPLPGAARYCARCGEVASSSDITLRLKYPASEPTPIVKSSLPMSGGRKNNEIAYLESTATTVTLASRLFRKSTRARLLDPDLEFDTFSLEDELADEFVEPHATWHKVVEHRTPATLPAVASTRFKRPGRRSRLFHSPRNFFWLALLALLALLLGGAFGVALSFGRVASKPKPVPAVPTLQGSPPIIALGGIVNLRGSHFAPYGQVTLSRDNHLPLTDTGGANTLQADAQGSFSDTVVIDPLWLAGIHSLYATNKSTHEQAAFSVTVTGKNALQGPPHLLLSATGLDLGAGDPVTNNSKLLALSNAGGGLVTWQASTNKPWLQITPKSGTITSGSHLSVIVVGNRSGLDSGTYQASISFSSNTEQVTLGVSMQVIPLQVNHEAVLQVSTAALSFAATAGATGPQSQPLAVNNPGVQMLSWGSSISVQNSSGWLSVTPGQGDVAPGGQQNVAINVRSSGLAPGVYKGTLLFSNQGTQAIQGDLQSVYVTLNVAPLCTLSLVPDNLTFTGTTGQSAPDNQALKMSVAKGCTTNQQWSATVATNSGGKWLTLNHASGSTLTTLQVGVNTAGLAAGTYSGTLTFTGSVDVEIVSVTLHLKAVPPVPCSITAPGTLNLQGTAGQADPATQSVTLSTGGSCPDALDVTTTTTAAWLSASSSGTLIQPATAGIAIQAALSGLAANTYTGTMTISAVDSVTNQTVGTVSVTVTLTVLPPCTLQAPSTGTLAFSAATGSDPLVASQNFTIGLTGNCSGAATIMPAVSDSNATWLAVSPGINTVSSGGMATFAVTVTSSTLAIGTYTVTISLYAQVGSTAIAASPQSLTVMLTVS